MVIRRSMRRIFYNGDKLDGETVFVVVMVFLIAALGTAYLYLGLYSGRSW